MIKGLKIICKFHTSPIGANLIEEEQFVTEVMETYQYSVVQHLFQGK
jgi:hypothetical protein